MPPVPGALCVHCRRAPAAPEWRPFCSQRCRLLDLAGWVDGRHRIPGDPGSPDPDEPSPTEP